MKLFVWQGRTSGSGNGLAWQVTDNYLNQWWLSSMTDRNIAKPWWFKIPSIWDTILQKSWQLSSDVMYKMEAGMEHSRTWMRVKHSFTGVPSWAHHSLVNQFPNTATVDLTINQQTLIDNWSTNINWGLINKHGWTRLAGRTGQGSSGQIVSNLSAEKVTNPWPTPGHHLWVPDPL